MKRLLFFTLPGCAPCERLKPLAKNIAGSAYQEFDIVRDPTSRQVFNDLGFVATPAVAITDENGVPRELFDGSKLVNELESGNIATYLGVSQPTPPNTGTTTKMGPVILLLIGLYLASKSRS